MRIADRIVLGFPPLRHDEAKVELGLRNVTYGLAIKDGNAFPLDAIQEQSIGDVNGATLWRAQDKGARPLPGWSFGWSAQVTRPAADASSQGNNGRGAAGGSGGGEGGGGAAGPIGGTGQSFGVFGARPGQRPGGSITGTFGGWFGAGAQGGSHGSLGHINVGGRPASMGWFGVGDPASLGQLGSGGLNAIGSGDQRTKLGNAQGLLANDPISGGIPSATSRASPNTAPSGTHGAGAGGAATHGKGGGGGADPGAAGGGAAAGVPNANPTATTDRGAEEPLPDGFVPTQFQPTRTGNLDADTRFEPKTAAFPRWASRLPNGWPGTLMAASNEDSQEEVFHPDASALVSGCAPDARADLSTAVVDLGKDDKVDPSRRALLCDFMRVVKAPQGVDACGLSWNIAIDLARPLLSGYVTDNDMSGGAATSIRGEAVPVCHAIASRAQGGPLDCGDLDDKQLKIGKDADGNAVNSLAFTTEARFRKQTDRTKTGPIKFEDGPFPGLIRGNAFMPVHIRFDAAGYSPNRDEVGAIDVSAFGARGVWSAYAEGHIDDDAPPIIEDPPPPPPPPPPPEPPLEPPPRQPPWTPPRTPPPPLPPLVDPWKPQDGPPQLGDWPWWESPVDAWGNPIGTTGHTGGNHGGGMIAARGVRYIGPTIRDTPRPLAQMYRELAVPALVFKPHSFGCGARDLRNDQRGDAAAQRKHLARDPVVMRTEAAWAKAGGDCNQGEPTYTNPPGNARYRSGTASGVVADLPGEVGLEDYATNFAPAGITVSTVYRVALKGKVFHGSGYPDPTGGLCKSGNIWGTDTATGAFKVQSTTAAGAVDKSQSLALVTGTIPVASSITDTSLLKFSGTTGEVVAVGDAAAARTLIGLGTISTQAASAVAITGGTIQVTKGSAAGAAYVGGVINSQYADAGNVTTGEDDLHSYSLPANALNANGDSIEFEAFGVIAAGGGDAFVRVQFDGTEIFELGRPAAAENYHIQGTIVRTGAATQRVCVRCAVSAAATAGDAYVLYSALTKTLSGALVLKTTGEFTDGTTNGIIEKSFSVKWFPAYPA